MTTKLPSRRDTRRALRPVPETPSPRPCKFRHRSGDLPTLPAALPLVSRTTTTQTLPMPGRMCFQRSASLTEDRVLTEARSARRIDLKSISSSESTLSPPESAKTPSAEDDALHSPPLHRAPSPPPPALPPRAPLRPIRGGPKHRTRLPAKQRSMSEAPLADLVLPRRAQRSSSETVDSRRSPELLDVRDVLDSTRGSSDSVFESNNDDDKHVSVYGFRLCLYYEPR